MQKQQKFRGRLFFLFFSLLLLARSAAGSQGVDLNANWQYGLSGGEQKEDEQAFRQHYLFDLQSTLTEAMAVSSNLSYRTQWQEGSGTSEILSPSLLFTIQNDIFRTNFHAIVTNRKNPDRPDHRNGSWETTLYSAWQRFLWPSLSLNAGQDYVEDDASPRTSDSDRTHAGLDFDWDLLVLKTYYRFYTEEINDQVNRSIAEDTSHFARAETSHLFWADRLAVSLAHQFTQNRQEFGAEAEAGLTILRRVAIQQIRTAVDASPVSRSEFGPEDANILEAKPALNDDLLTVPLGNGLPLTDLLLTIGQDQEVNIFLDFGGSTFLSIDRLLLYVDPEEVNQTAISGFAWEVYTRPNETVSWQLVESTTDFNSQENRIELTLSPGIQQRLVKIVAVSQPVQSVTFTEVDAVHMFTTSSGLGTETRTFQTHLSDFNLGARLTPALDFAYTAQVENNSSDHGSDIARSAQSGTLKWRHSPYFNPTLGISETRNETEGSPESLIRSYGVTIASYPLPTLDLSLSGTRTENYEDGEKSSANYNLAFLSNAILFPDLTSRWDMTYSSTENLQSNQSSDTLHSRLNFTARLRSTVTADLFAEHSRISSGTHDTQATLTAINVNYRPSEIFSLRVNGTETFGDQAPPATLGVNLNVGLVHTAKTQLTFNYNFQDGSSTRKDYGLLWSWLISRHFSLQTNAFYLEGDTTQWNLTSQLSARF